MKPEDRLLFETLLKTHPDFLKVVSWAEGPDPPDVVLTDSGDRIIGVELTEWLDKEETNLSISFSEKEFEWLKALDTENHRQPLHFKIVQISFRPDAPYSERDR